MRNPAASSNPHPAEAGTKRELSPCYLGEGHGRREELGGAAPKNPPAYRGRNGCTVGHGTGEARLGTGATAAGCQPAVPGNSETYKQRSCEVVERRAGVGGGHTSEEGVDNITRQSKGPLAGRAGRTGKGCGSAFGLGPRSRSVIRTASLGRPPTPWRGGTWTADCPGESRVIEKVMHGLGRGRWKRASESMVSGNGHRERKRPEQAPGTYRHTRTAPAPYFTCVLQSCDRLAGGSPAGVAAKRPRS
jgi:hypothetical protein